MRRFFTKPRTHGTVLAMMALAASALLAACSSGERAPTTLPTAPAPATSVATATTALVTMPTIVPLTPTSPATMAPTAVRQATSPTATGSVIAKGTSVPAAPPPTTPKPTAIASRSGGTLSACEVITKADVEAVLGVPVTVPPAGVPGAVAPPGVPGAPEDGTSICIYAGQGKGSEGVMISLGQPDPGDPAVKLPLTQAIKGSALQPLGGIGDEAATDGQHIVVTRKNGRQLAVIIGWQVAGDASGLDAGKRLAKIGADRL